MPRIHGIRDVAERQLCLGCGVCSYLQPEAIQMVDVLDHGRRPLVRVDSTGVDLATDEALRVCPGLRLEHTDPPREAYPELLDEWGPVLEVWEGYAADREIRYAASSGGAATALALHCIERAGMHGVLHITSRPDVPYLNHTVLSTSRAELLAATGSRYAPASPCDRLDLVEAAPAPCVFIGKPCDVAGANRAAELRPALLSKIGLTIGIFCAGTPSIRGTLELARVAGCEDPASITGVRYRGNGWPGQAEVTFQDGGGKERVERLSYEDSWGKILQRHRQWRCYVCADHTGEFADIAVGDPWYREIGPEEPGHSLVVVRTEHGRRIVHEALRAGALVLEKVPPSVIADSQPGLLQVRGSVWGRIATCRSLRVPAPRYRRLPTFPTWWRRLNLNEKLRSTVGTLRRIVRRGLYRRVEVRPLPD